MLKGSEKQLLEVLKKCKYVPIMFNPEDYSIHTVRWTEAENPEFVELNCPGAIGSINIFQYWGKEYSVNWLSNGIEPFVEPLQDLFECDDIIGRNIEISDELAAAIEDYVENEAIENNIVLDFKIIMRETPIIEPEEDNDKPTIKENKDVYGQLQVDSIDDPDGDYEFCTNISYNRFGVGYNFQITPEHYFKFFSWYNPDAYPIFPERWELPEKLVEALDELLKDSLNEFIHKYEQRIKSSKKVSKKMPTKRPKLTVVK